MQIFVKTQSGDKIIIDMQLSDTSKQLKKKIQIQKEQILFLNNLRLTDYNIKNENVLYLHSMYYFTENLTKLDIYITEGIVYSVEKNSENECIKYFKIDKSPYTNKVIYGTKSNEVSIYDKFKEIQKKLKCIKEDERKKYDEFFLQQLRCD